MDLQNDKEKETHQFYERLKKELDISNTWPAVYLFKFIVPTSDKNNDLVDEAFNSMGAVIKTRKSKTGKYTSISVDVMMQNPQEIIDKYMELSTINGIISL
jgi:uncharacterized protein